MAGHGIDPIHQFAINKYIPMSIGGLDISFTNVALYILITVVLASGFLLVTSSGKLIPGRVQSISEIAYEFVASILRDAVGPAGMKFFPLVFSLFMFILVANFIALFPYAYTVTAQIIITFALAMVVILTVVIYGFSKHGFGFLRLFVPSGVPIVILPLVTLIEIISFLSRPVSLSVRLFANLLAGHITLKVFAGFVVSMIGVGSFGAGGAILPFIMTVAIVGLEVLVAFLQAYVFTVLACMYLNDAIHPGH